MSIDDERHERGSRIRRDVLGKTHVDAAEARRNPLTSSFQDYIVGAAWADVWGRPGLPQQTRSLVTIALLAALGHDHELEMHLRATRRTGATPEEVAEALLHVAVYAGVPAANRAFACLERVLGEDAQTGEVAT